MIKHDALLQYTYTDIRMNKSGLRTDHVPERYDLHAEKKT